MTRELHPTKLHLGVLPALVDAHAGDLRELGACDRAQIPGAAHFHDEVHRLPSAQVGTIQPDLGLVAANGADELRRHVL